MSNRNEIILDFSQSRGTISPMIYGHFAEHIGGVFYDGLWVGENSRVENVRGFRKELVDSFRKINPPVLRWPGGCFAETYDWCDGIGPREKRPERAGWWYTYDGRIESNAVGTHEFIDLCQMVGAEPYIAANMTTTTPLNIHNWIEYCNLPAEKTTLTRKRGENGSVEPFNVRYWGIGNENWGGGGQMTPEMYMREYIRYSTVCNNVDRGNLKFIMCGANAHDVNWTRRILQEWSQQSSHEATTWGMSVHYYCHTAGTPQSFTEDEWYHLLFKADFMRRIINDHRTVMDEFDPERKIGLIVDEWGCWHNEGTGPSHGYNLFEQQSSMRDAIVAALTLNHFNNLCDIVVMANIAQLCNNLHSLYLAGGENFVETPNYFVFDMFKGHQGGKQIKADVHCMQKEREGFNPLNMLSVSASVKDGILTVTMVNMDVTTGQQIYISGLHSDVRGTGTLQVLAHDDPHTCNTFDDPTAISPVCYEISLDGSGVIDLPAASVATMTLKLSETEGQ